eukprot:jgi/Mesvir1/26850/Mv25912-RA.1
MCLATYQHKEVEQMAAAQDLLANMLDIDTQLGVVVFARMLDAMNFLVKQCQQQDLQLDTLAHAIEDCKTTIRDEYVEGPKVFTGTLWKGFIDLDADTSPFLTDRGEVFRNCQEMEHPVTCQTVHEASGSRARYVSVASVTEEEFRLRVIAAQEQATAAAKVVLDDFDIRFPPNGLLSAMSILQPGWWTEKERDVAEVQKQVQVLKRKFAVGVTMVNGKKVGPLISPSLLDDQLDSFMLMMKSNSQEYTSARALWKVLLTNPLMHEFVGAYLQLAELMLLLPLTSVENERRFSHMNFIKSDIRNRLLERHLNVAVRIFACSSSYEDMPIQAAYAVWSAEKGRRATGSVLT